MQTDTPVDPSAIPTSARAAAQRLVDAGATMLSLRFVHHSVDHYVEQLEAMARAARGVSGPSRRARSLANGAPKQTGCVERTA